MLPDKLKVGVISEYVVTVSVELWVSFVIIVLPVSLGKLEGFVYVLRLDMDIGLKSSLYISKCEYVSKVLFTVRL